MKPRNLIILLVLIAAISPLRAQDEIPWPPDPSEIFAEGVEVISAYPIGDNDARAVYVFYNGMWRAYAYPDKIGEINEYGLSYHGENELWLNSKEQGGSTLRTLWTLDLDSGIFSPLSANLCGRIPGLWEAQQTVKWEYYTNPDTRIHYLCNAETGELSPPLPDWSPYWSGDEGMSPVTIPYESPGGSRVVFMGQLYGGGSSVNLGETVIAAYEPASQKFIQLGIGDGIDTAYVDYWLNDTLAIVYTGDMPSTFYRGYSLVDVTQPDSITSIVSMDGFEVSPQFYDNLSRFERLWIPVVEMYRSQYQWTRGGCRLEIIYVPQIDKHVFELGNDCVEAYRLDNGTYYVLDVRPDASALSAVGRFDPQIGEPTILLQGEIEAIYGISPEGHYALVLEDNSGKIDGTVDMGYALEWDVMHTPKLVLYDLHSGDRVHIFDLPTEDFRHYISRSWIGEQGLLFQIADRPGLQLIRFDDPVAEISLEVDYFADQYGRWSLSDDHRLLIWEDAGDSSRNLIAYNLLSENKALVAHLPETAYDKIEWARWQDDNTLSIQMSDGKYAPQSVTYTVRIN